MVGKRSLALCLALAFVVACGGASPSSTAGGASSAAATAAGATATNAGGNAAGGATPAAGNGPKLADLLAAGKLASYKVTYKMTVSGAGADAFSGDQTWYFKPPRARFDFAMTQGGQKTTLSFFSLPEGTYYCFGAGGAGTQCLSVGGVGSPLDQNFAAAAQQSLMQNPDQFGATFTSQRTIAGQQGYCYDVKPSAGLAGAAFSAGSFCYSKDGLALLSSFTAAGSSWSMEATNLSTTVPDSDFTLPAKPAGR